MSEINNLMKSVGKVLKFRILDENVKYYEKFNRTERKIIFKMYFDPGDYVSFLEIYMDVENNMESLIKFLIKDYNPDDLFSIRLWQEDNYETIYIPPQRIGDFKVKDVFDKIEAFTDVFGNLSFDGLFQIDVMINEKR